jgi:hypothetical protein
MLVRSPRGYGVTTQTGRRSMVSPNGCDVLRRSFLDSRWLTRDTHAWLARDKRSARRHFVSEWLLEFSVLWAVFPMLDQMLTDRFQPWIINTGVSFSMLSFVAGLFIRPKEH